MRGAIDAGGFPTTTSGSGFSDRAVAGGANPTSVDIEVTFEPDEVVARVVLRQAFEGAPGRAHGGIVAAAFDDVTGFVIGQVREPAFTGELTVRYLAPVPVNEPIEMRARLESRERRKLFITAEARHHGERRRDVPRDLHNGGPHAVRRLSRPTLTRSGGAPAPSRRTSPTLPLRLPSVHKGEAS